MIPDLVPSAKDCLVAVLDVLVITGLIDRFASMNARAYGDDEMTAAAHDLILNALSDADRVRSRECCTGVDLRAQLTIEQAQALADEAALRRMKNRN